MIRCPGSRQSLSEQFQQFSASSWVMSSHRLPLFVKDTCLVEAAELSSRLAVHIANGMLSRRTRLHQSSGRICRTRSHTSAMRVIPSCFRFLLYPPFPGQSAYRLAAIAASSVIRTAGKVALLLNIVVEYGCSIEHIPDYFFSILDPSPILLN